MIIQDYPSSLLNTMIKLHVLKTDLFRVLREKLGANLHSFIEDKVSLVPGDIACDSLDKMCTEVDIIVNSAATTRFDERYDTAISINVLGAMHVVEFSKQSNVSGEKEGLILEKPLNYGETLNGGSVLDIQVEQRLVEEALKDLQVRHATGKEVISYESSRARLHGWPNTYSFTKVMGEMLLGHFNEDLRLIILRPTIILSTYKEPFPGWIEGMRTIDTFIAGYGKGKQKVAIGGRDSIADVIPADMVVNSVIAAIVPHQNPSSHTVVYHISSSKRNQLKSGDIIQFFVDYFKKNPWIDERGKPVKVKKFHVLGSMESLHKYIGIHYMPALKILKWTNSILCQHLQAQHANLERRINGAIRLAELYRPYAFFKGVFDDTNAEMLRMAMRESNADDTLNFDPTTIQWEKYFKETHIQGVVKYIF
ncbi:hypothetical protein P3S68_010080 [Capsicum galapagoense]